MNVKFVIAKKLYNSKCCEKIRSKENKIMK